MSPIAEAVIQGIDDQVTFDFRDGLANKICRTSPVRTDVTGR